MLFIAILAFANMFYVINGDATSRYLDPNDETDENFEYVGVYSGYAVIDSVLAIFLILFGDFKYDDFSKGPDSAQCWFFFVLACYVLIIVFMNMLIAI